VNLTNKGKIATHLARHNRRSSAEKVWLRGREVRYNFGTIEVEIFGRFLGVSDTNETIYVKRLPACKADALPAERPHSISEGALLQLGYAFVQVSVGKAIDRIRELRKQNTLGGLKTKDLIHEGHKY